MDKENLLLVHGFLGSPRDWHEVQQVFSQKYNVITVDLQEWKLAQYSINQLSNHLIKLLTPVKSCIAVGYSMGGRILLDSYFKKPQLFKTLVLESTSPGLEKKRSQRYALDQKRAEELKTNPSQFFKHWYSQAVFQNLSPEQRHQLIKIRQQCNYKQWAQILREASPGINPSHWLNLRSVQCPTLWLMGEEDTQYTANKDRLLDSNALFKVETIPGVGHNIHFEKNNTFVSILNNFLENRSSL